MLSIFLGILLLSSLGFTFGIGLAIIAKIFHVEVDPKIEQILEVLPGVNCGACGYPGCAVYAEALVKDDVEIIWEKLETSIKRLASIFD